MRNFQKKESRVTQFLHSTPVLSVLVFLALFFIYSLWGLVGKMINTSRNRDLAEKKVAELEERKQTLTLDIAKLNTAGGVEENIREKFGLIREGEGLVVVVEEKEGETAAEPESGGFWNFLKNIFR